MLDISDVKDICNRRFLVMYSQGSPDAYYLSMDGFTGTGGHPKQLGALESRGNGRYYCFKGYL